MPDGGTRKPALNCLWLARAMPYPLTAGDRIYSAKLAESLADAGANIVFAGLAAESPYDPLSGLHWHVVPGGPRSQWSALFSPLPLVAARHATPAYRRHATELLRSRKWDAVIIDHYGSGWLTNAIPDQTVRVFIAHNHEAGVTRSQWLDTGRSIPNRTYLWQNWLKTARLEQRVVRNSDLVTAITGYDAEQFANASRTIVLTPGYDGARVEHRVITSDTPRSVVMFGSYQWSAKRASLTLFLDQADAVMAQAGITIDVVGDMDPQLRRTLASKYRAARFHGFVDDASGILAAARLAVLAEPVGGGFKLKLLEYIFNRVPVAALTACASGLPQAVRSPMLLEDDIPALIKRVVAEIDQVDYLNASQTAAYAAADGRFDWSDRGQALLEAIMEIQSGHPSTIDERPRLINRADT